MPSAFEVRSVLFPIILLVARAHPGGIEAVTGQTCQKILDAASVRVDVALGVLPKQLTYSRVINTTLEKWQVALLPEPDGLTFVSTSVVSLQFGDPSYKQSDSPWNSITTNLSLDLLESAVVGSGDVIWCLALRHAVYHLRRHFVRPTDDVSTLVDDPSFSVEIGQYGSKTVGVLVMDKTCVHSNRLDPSCVLAVFTLPEMEVIFRPERWGSYFFTAHVNELQARLQSVTYQGYGHRLMDSSLLSNLEDCGRLRNLTLIDSVAIASGGYIYCYGLEHLDLSGNLLNNLEAWNFGFSQYKRIVSMNLSRCNISNISFDFGTKFPTLKYLDMSWNNLNTEEALQSLLGIPDLEILNLSHNDIANISELHFPNDTKIQYLDFSNNLLLTLPQIFSSGPLGTLDFSSNLIGTLSTFLISGSVNNLNLSNNTIEEWNSEDTEVFSGITHVNLSTNIIVIFSERMLRSFNTLHSVDIGTNPISCRTCRSIGPLWKWLKADPSRTYGVRVFNSGTENLKITCGFNKPGNMLPVLEAAVDWRPCRNPRFVILSIANAVTALFVVVTLLAYRYRYELIYLIEYLRLKRRLLGRQPYDSFKHVFDAFVLYSHHNRDWVVEQLCPNLEKDPENYSLCLHEKDFPLGSMIVDHIGMCLNISRYVIAVLSPAFIQSRWCRWELEQANNRLLQGNQEILIVIVLDTVDRGLVPPHLQFLLGSRTCLKWSDLPSASQWEWLRRELGQSIYQMGLAKTSLKEVEDESEEEL